MRCMAVTYAVLCLVLIPVEVVNGGNTFTLPDKVFFKNYGNASSCVTEHEEET